ncbi:MAG: hypothetical protein R2845_15580 [Thermomicrobiales bacterium]
MDRTDSSGVTDEHSSPEPDQPTVVVPSELALEDETEDQEHESALGRSRR